MIVALTIGAAVLLIVGEIFVMAAAGTFKRGLGWSDFVALIMPPIALTSIVASFVFLHWAIALILTIALFAVVIWAVAALLKLPTQKEFR